MPAARSAASISDQGAIGALGQHIRALVEQLVQDRQPQVGHAQVVEIGEDQGDVGVDAVPVFDHLVELAAGIAAGFLHGGEDAFEARIDIRGVNTSKFPYLAQLFGFIRRASRRL